MSYDWKTVTYINITNVRESLLNKHYDTLIETGTVDCNSALLRKILYLRLNSENRKFKSEIIGYNKSVRRYTGHQLNNAKRIYQLINKGKISESLVRQVYDTHTNKNLLLPSCVTFDEVLELYNNDVGFERKIDIINRVKSAKFNIFYAVGIRKPIKRITLTYDESK
jgi:hypothetical protein